MENDLLSLDNYSPYQKSLLKHFLSRASSKEVEQLIVDYFTESADVMFSKPKTANSWQKQITKMHLRRPHRKNIVDDGFYSVMASGAQFVSTMQIPRINPVNLEIAPKRAIPFSKLNHAEEGDVCVFHENDSMFADYLIYDEMREIAHKKVSLFASADCSLYTDMPLCLQVANIYMNRLTAYDLQNQGKLHAPLCRWGDERTYKPYITDIPLAFIGLPKNNAVWIGTYGVSKHQEDKKHLRSGLEAMIEWLSPVRIFVYGSLPGDIFGDLSHSNLFTVYPNWTSLMHGRHS